LSAWALDALVADRGAAPWPAVRAAAGAGRGGGLAVPLQALTAAFAACCHIATRSPAGRTVHLVQPGFWTHELYNLDT